MTHLKCYIVEWDSIIQNMSKNKLVLKNKEWQIQMAEMACL